MTNYKINFGTDGWRGLLDSEVNEDSIAAVAQAFSEFVNSSSNETCKKVAISFDGRRNSQLFGKIFAEVLSGNNIQALLSDRITPTPVLSYFVKQHALFAGVMITASHNPPKYNGIKFKDGSGAPFSTEQTKMVEENLYKSDCLLTTNLVEIVDMFGSYLQHVESLIDFKAIRESGIQPCIDSMGGAGQTILHDLLSKYEISSTTIYGNATIDFCGRKAEPIAQNLQELKDTLQHSNNFAVGFATDGDADRLGVLDEKGNWFSAHETILALAYYYSEIREVTGDLVKSASVTSKMEKLQNTQRKVHNVQVGFKYIAEKMITTGAAFGAEESGGFGFKEHIPERDGIFSALVFLEMMAMCKFDTVTDIRDFLGHQFGKICYNRIDFDYFADDRSNILPAISDDNPTSIAGYNVISTESFRSSRNVTNGIKWYLDELRWLILRCSETEPMFRIYCEANTNKEVEELLQFGLQMITTKKHE